MTIIHKDRLIFVQINHLSRQTKESHSLTQHWPCRRRLSVKNQPDMSENSQISRNLYPRSVAVVSCPVISVPLEKGGEVVMEEAAAEIIQQESLHCFYFAANFLLTRPEVVWKNVHTSFLSSVKVTSEKPVDTKLQKIYEDLFYRLIRLKELDMYFLNEKLKKVEVERVWVVDNKDFSHVIFIEIWDFEKKMIRYGPKFRKEFESDESQYNNLIPLVTCDWKFSFDADLLVSVFVIRPDDTKEKRFQIYENGVDKIRDIFEQYSVSKWDSVNRGFQNHPTLLHIERQDYGSVREYLKIKFQKQLKSYWEMMNVSTDPIKFISEDVNIASYLSCLQSSSRSPIRFDKKFVDLGCGNGLLTFLLTKLGWKGYGIDMRRRELWKKFEKGGAQYQEFEIKFDTKLMDVDSNTIIIGNHPDELAPLIPLLTLQNKAAGFILIPCCAFDMFGNKYIRSECQGSVYEAHVRALLKMSKDLLFDTKLDKLRIPSTKRIAILGGNGAETTETPHSRRLKNLNLLTDLLQSLKGTASELENFEENSKSKLQRVNNMTQLDGVYLHGIVIRIFRQIFNTRCTGVDLCSSCTNILVNPEAWRSGCEMVTLREVLDRIDKTKLKFIKGQGRGITTLIKNYSDVLYMEDGFVRIHKPDPCHIEKILAGKKAKKIRTKACFHHFNHPQGCPLTVTECAFSHKASLYQPRRSSVPQLPKDGLNQDATVLINYNSEDNLKAE